jgi:hypothetical protein
VATPIPIISISNFGSSPMAISPRLAGRSPFSRGAGLSWRRLQRR